MSETNSPRWIFPTDVSLRWRCWDDGCVVYHEGTGDTHLFQEPLVTLIQSLSDTAISEKSLADLIREKQLVGDSDEATLASYLNRSLEELSRLGIVQRVEEDRGA